MDMRRERISKAGSHGWQTNKQREKTSKHRRQGAGARQAKSQVYTGMSSAKQEDRQKQRASQDVSRREE